jgi:Right handed beta helix region
MREFLLVVFFTIFPVLAHGATYYVAKTGSDSNSCANAQSQSTPKLTINAGAACLSGGDTLIVKAGSYTESLINNLPSGTAGSPTVLKSEVNHGAVMFTDATGTANWCTICLQNKSYITIDGMVLDGSHTDHAAHVYIYGTSDHIVVQNNEIRFGNGHCNSTDNPMGIATGPATPMSSFIVVRNNDIHHISINVPGGCAFYGYGMYFYPTDSLVEGNDIHDNASYGIHNYNGASLSYALRNVYRNNKIHDNGFIAGQAGILYASGGSDNQFYNNIVYNNATFGVQVSGFGVTASNNTLYNNTFYGNGLECIRLGSSSGGGPVNTTIRNNICYGNGTDDVVTAASDTTGTVSDHNLLGTNPLFVNASLTVRPNLEVNRRLR